MFNGLYKKHKTIKEHNGRKAAKIKKQEEYKKKILKIKVGMIIALTAETRLMMEIKSHVS